MQALIFNKDILGHPLDTLQTDLASKRPDVTFSHSAMWGPLSATVTWSGSAEEGFDAAERFLGCPIEIWSPEGEWCWEGIVWTVSFGAGQRRRRRSREGYAERVFVLFQSSGETSDGGPNLQVAGDNLNIHSKPHYVANISGPWTIPEAYAYAEAELERRSKPLWLPESGGTLPVLTGGSPTIEIRALGWYNTLWYVPLYGGYLLTDTMRNHAIWLIEDSPFVVQDYSKIGPYEETLTLSIEHVETPGEVMKRILPMGIRSGGDRELLFGLMRGRVPYLKKSKRMSTEVDYVERSDGSITTANGGLIRPHSVRPDTILKQQDFVPTKTSLISAIDSIENVYLSETTYSSRTDSVDYKSSVAGLLGGLDES